MEDIRFGWIGEARRTALRSMVAAEVALWSRAWWFQHSSTFIDVQACDFSDSTDEAHALISTADGGLLAFHTDQVGTQALGCHLLGLAADEGIDWSQRIGLAALQDFVTRIHQRAEITEAPTLEAARVPRSLGDARFGSYHLCISLGSLNLYMSCSRRLVDLLVPERNVEFRSLSQRRGAVSSVRVTLEGLLNFGSVNLAQLSDLKVGEILVGDHELSGAISIVLDGRDEVASGLLRRTGSQRVLVMNAVSKK